MEENTLKYQELSIKNMNFNLKDPEHQCCFNLGLVIGCIVATAAFFFVWGTKLYQVRAFTIFGLAP